MKLQRNKKGFSLLEMLLVLAIVGAAMVMLISYSANKLQQMKLERATLQMQQVLNSALTYYINNSVWPSCGSLVPACVLISEGYLPPPMTSGGSLKNPFGNTILVGSTGASGNAAQFYVASNVGSVPNALTVAGRLPFGIITTLAKWNTGTSAGGTSVAVDSTGTYAVASVTIPGQNLNNARAINFAGIYRSGACVPAPTCPTGMIPQIYVAPAGVSGVNDTPSCSNSSCASNTYPVTSFVAFARGGDAATQTLPVDRNPYNCVLVDTANYGKTSCLADVSPYGDNSMLTRDPYTSAYWRVCLNIITEKGNVRATTEEQGRRMGSIMAITRCVPGSGTTSTETPTGTRFDVYIPNSNWAE